MQINRKSIKPVLVNALLLIIAYIIQYNRSFSIAIGHASPMLCLCVTVSFAIFSTELNSVVFALFSGILADTAAATPICFNTFSFMIISIGVSFTVHYLFNNNIRSCIALGIISFVLYYAVRFAFCMQKTSLDGSVSYLLNYALPSVIYSCLIIIPLYFLNKHLFLKSFAR